MNKEVDDPRNLIDLELIKLLSYCHKLQAYKEEDEYEDALL
jgi:hypothetical protein